MHLIIGSGPSLLQNLLLSIYKTLHSVRSYLEPKMEQLLPPSLLDLGEKLAEKWCQVSNILQYSPVPQGLQRNPLKGKLRHCLGWGCPSSLSCTECVWKGEDKKNLTQWWVLNKSLTVIKSSSQINLHRNLKTEES